MHAFLQILPDFDWLCLVYIRRSKFYDWGSEVSGLSISNIKKICQVVKVVDTMTQTDKAVQHYLHTESSFLTL